MNAAIIALIKEVLMTILKWIKARSIKDVENNINKRYAEAVEAMKVKSVAAKNRLKKITLGRWIFVLVTLPFIFSCSAICSYCRCQIPELKPLKPIFLDEADFDYTVLNGEEMYCTTPIEMDLQRDNEKKLMEAVRYYENMVDELNKIGEEND